MRTNGIRTSFLAGIALLTTALAGCGSSQGDLEKWVAEVKARPAPPLDPLPVVEDHVSSFYLHLEVNDEPGVLAEVAQVLGLQKSNVRGIVRIGPSKHTQLINRNKDNRQRPYLA